MTIYLKNYHSEPRMAVVAKNQDVFIELRSRNVDVMHITLENIRFYPNYVEINIEKNEFLMLSKLEDYDIVEINEKGILYRTYADNEPDSTLFLGARCNSNCIMCPASDMERRKGFTYSPELLEKYISYLPENIEYLVITGGEPTIDRFQFIKALEKVKKKFMNTQILLLTNGRSLSSNEFLDEMCSHLPNHFRAAIPLHGSYAAIHDQITRVPGSFDQTRKAVKKLLLSRVQVEIRIVVSKVNCDNLSEIATLIIKEFHNVYCVNFVGLEPRGNCVKNAKAVYIDHKTAFSKSKQAIDLLIHSGIDVGLYNFPLCCIGKGYWALASKSIAQYKSKYHIDCDKCDAKPLCGGLFTATLDFIRPDVYPVKL